MAKRERKLDPIRENYQMKPKIKKPNKQTLSLAAVLAFFIASVWLGMALERSRTPEPLPANQQCLTALDTASKAFAGEKVDLASAIADCKNNAGHTTVNVEVK